MSEFTKAVLNEIERAVSVMLGPFEDLVWYASVPPRGDEHWAKIDPKLCEDSHLRMSRIEERYPDEVEEIQTPGAEGNWTRGFNAGVLGAIRFVMETRLRGAEIALDNFPDIEVQDRPKGGKQ